MKFTSENLLRLYSVPGIGGVRMRQLISIFGSPENVLNASVRELMEVEGIDKIRASKIHSGVDEEFVREQLVRVNDYGVKLLSYWDEEYPERLKSIFDPPPFLFARGDFSIMEKPAFAIVGTRNPTSYGRMITEQIAADLTKHNFVIISGFARGVDTAAHKAAFKHGGKTIAVLGNGVDLIYPAANRELYSQMLDNGLLLSEYPMGAVPDAGNFPKRNRLISGMSYGVLITEAGAKSGALLTAMYGLDQNREIFAVPGTVVSENSKGTNKLIKEGAKLVESVDDILIELKSILNINMDSVEAKEKALPDLKGSDKLVYDFLSLEPVHIDQIAYKTGLSTSEALSVLLTLELMGHIKQLAGKMFVRL
ncbi:MAG: DNA-processing protein DprA [Calditrichaceae bacterium]|nr:DNA-processing protein DprA [Calditrichaceae bacterium]MBN2709161.1 DNA-processing protein DprA [Calditrichaceae bacterium]RQV96117.1 MAG: DNA-protecting protein DprA [Calditrichota bacterium]